MILSSQLGGESHRKGQLKWLVAKGGPCHPVTPNTV